jgi:hypothetical protein
MSKPFRYTHQLVDEDGMAFEKVMAWDGRFVDHYTWHTGGQHITQASLIEMGYTAQPLQTPQECSCKACGGSGRSAPIQAKQSVDREWQREIAMEAGMLHGVHAYNEAMGYDSEEP